MDYKQECAAKVAAYIVNCLSGDMPPAEKYSAVMKLVLEAINDVQANNEGVWFSDN